MPDAFDQIANDTVTRDYGGRPPPLSDPRGLGGSSTPVSVDYGGRPPPITAPLGNSYNDLLDGLTGRNGYGFATEGATEQIGSAGEIRPPFHPWPPTVALSPQTEAGFGPGEIPTVPPREKPPGLMARLGKKLVQGLTGGGVSPEEQVAQRGFAAQAEIEARQHPYWENLPTDESKLRFLNVFRRRYGLDPADKVEPPEDIYGVAGRQWGTMKGLLSKIPFVETGMTVAELWKVHEAIGRVEAGKGTIDDWEALTQLQERMAKESRGRTVAGQGLNIASESVPFWAGLGVGEGMTRPLIKGAEKVAEKVAGKSATKAAVEAMGRMAEKAATKTAGEGLMRGAGRVATHAAFESVKRGIPVAAVGTVADTMRRTLPQYELRPGDDQALDYITRAPGQDLLGAIRDSSIKQSIEVYSEFTGDVVGIFGTRAAKAGQALAKAGAKVPGVRKIAIPAERAGEWVARTRAGIAAELVRRFPDEIATLDAATQFMRTRGIGNVFEEMGEERIAEIMEAAAKAVVQKGGESSTLESYSPPEWKQLQSEFLGFILPGAARDAAIIPAMGIKAGYEYARSGLPRGTPPGPGEADIPETPAGPRPPMEVFPARPVHERSQGVHEHPQEVGGPTQQATIPPATERILSDTGPTLDDLAQKVPHTEPESPVNQPAEPEERPPAITQVPLDEGETHEEGLLPTDEEAGPAEHAENATAGDDESSPEEGQVADHIPEATKKVSVQRRVRGGFEAKGPGTRMRVKVLNLQTGDVIPGFSPEPATVKGVGVHPHRPHDTDVLVVTDQGEYRIAPDRMLYIDRVTKEPIHETKRAETETGGPAGETVADAGTEEQPRSGEGQPARPAEAGLSDRPPERAADVQIREGEITPTRGGLIVRDLRTGEVTEVNDRTTAEAKAKLAELRKTRKPHLPAGAATHLMGDHAVVREAVVDSDMGVEYNLAQGTGGGKTRWYVRVYDQELDKVVGLKYLPTEQMAREYYADLIRKAWLSLQNAAKAAIIPEESEHGTSRRETPATAPHQPGGQGEAEQAGADRPGRAPRQAAEDVPGAGGAGAVVPLGLEAATPGDRETAGHAGQRGEVSRGSGPGDVGTPRPSAGGLNAPGKHVRSSDEETGTAAAHGVAGRSGGPVDGGERDEGRVAEPAGKPRPAGGREADEETRTQAEGRPGEIQPGGLSGGRTQRKGTGPAADGGPGDTDRQGSTPAGKRGPEPAGEADSDRGSADEGTAGGGQAVRHGAGGQAGAKAGGAGVADQAAADRPVDRRGAAAPEKDRGRGVHVGGDPHGDYVITDPGSLFASGDKTIFRRNVEAIRIVKQLTAENRHASDTERAKLVQYQGWGSLKAAFNLYGNMAAEARQLRELLTEEEWSAAEASTKNAMYTPPAIVTGMWKALEHMGFAGGNVLEPSAGVGHFLGLQPGELIPGGKRVAIEKDAITAAILKAIYPVSDVRHQGFEEAALPKNYFDVAISNVPFGDYGIHDKRYPKLVKQQIHDYFFARAMDLVRPGGMLAFITSKGTMDKLEPRVRQYLAERADLVGAVRLNDKSLPGTEVIADVIFLRKRAEGAPAAGESWVNAKEWPGLEGKFINEYFHNHPDMVLGTIKPGSLYGSGIEGAGATTVEAPKGFDLEAAITKAFDRLPEDAFGKGTADVRYEDVDLVPSPTDLPQGALFTGNDGKLRRSAGKGQPAELIDHTLRADLGSAAVDRVKALVDFRDGLLGLMSKMREPVPDEAINDLQAELSKKYDALTRKKYTPLSSSYNAGVLMEDPITYSLISSEQVESIDPQTKKPAKGSIFTRRLLAAYEKPSTADTPSDALAITLDETGKIDLNRISQLLQSTPDDARQRLIDDALVYELPGDQLILSAEYLSGAVRAKLREAKAAAQLDKKYARNVTALEAVQPADLPPSRIRAVLGSPWIPARAIEDFVVSIAGERYRRSFSIARNERTGKYTVSGARYVVTPATTQTWGTRDYNTAELIEDALQMKTPVVKRSSGSGDNKVTWVDQAASDVAAAKLKEVREYFERWLWGHEKWGPQLLKEYNEQFNDWVNRQWDGSHMTFPGSNPAIARRSYQKNAVYQGLASQEPVLVDVAVGGGKTFIGTDIAVQALRLGLARKVAIVVDRATVDQFAAGARLLYPGANIVTLGSKSLTSPKRPGKGSKENPLSDEEYARRLKKWGQDVATSKKARTLSRVALAEKTVFIIPHKQFQMLPASEATLNEFYADMLADIDLEIEEARAAKVNRRIINQLLKTKEDMEARLKGQIEDSAKTGFVPFEELGIDWIIYDEAHKLKNLRFSTQMQKVRGLGNPTGSQMALDAYMKTRYVRRLQNGRGVTFMTGTPINNSISELYAMQRYLQEESLRELNIRSFDDWVRMFAEDAVDLERVAGRYKWVTRLRRFKNLKGLYGLWNRITHTVPADQVAKVIRETSGDIPIIAENSSGKRDWEIVTLPVTPAQKSYQREIQRRVKAIEENLKKGPPQPGDDIMLAVITDEKKASLDMRLIDPGLAEEQGNKLTAAANHIAAIHKKYDTQQFTQMVFMNMGAPGSKMPFSTYTDLISKLVERGIPRGEIATIFDAGDKDSAKAALMERFNAGEIRILIGSMKKMGQGVNIQQRAVALHQLEPAWEPGTLIQMLGRILRSRSNKLIPEVHLFRYVAKGMADEFMYSLLAAKAQVNGDFLSGKLESDEIEDLDASSIAFKMAMAEGSESKTVLEYAKAEQQLRRLESQARYHLDSQATARGEIASVKQRLGHTTGLLPRIRSLEKYISALPSADPLHITIKGKGYDKMVDAGRKLMSIADDSSPEQEIEVGEARGLSVTLERTHGTLRTMMYILRLHPDDRATAETLKASGLRNSGAFLETLVVNPTAPASDRELSNWVAGAIRDPEALDLKQFPDRVEKLKKELSEWEAIIGQPFGQQEELDQLRVRVRTLADQLAAEAEAAAKAAEGHVAEEDLGQGDSTQEQEGNDEGDDDGKGGGGGGMEDFPPEKESLLPKYMSPEYRSWLRENWQRPVFGMGATSSGPPAPTSVGGKAWQAYADSWDHTVERLRDMKTKQGQDNVDLIARLLYGGQWKLPPESEVGQALDIARGAKHLGAQQSIIFNEALDKIIQGKREGAVGKPWPEESWDVIRQTALAVLKGGHRKPDILPADMQKVWKAHFGWVQHVSTAMTPKDRRLEIEYQLSQVEDRIADLVASTLVRPMPTPAWDAFAIAEHRKILDVVNEKADWDSLDADTQAWLNTVKDSIDALTDEMLADPIVMQASQGGGLQNFEEIVRMRRMNGAVYLRSLYHIVRDPALLLNWKRETLGPRLVMGMTKAKRAKDLYTVRLANGQHVQFHDQQEAIAFAEQEKALWASEYGESIHRRVGVLDPLTDDQIEWLGPVEDLRVLVAKTITGMAMHIDTARLFHTVDRLEALDEAEYMDLPEQEKHKYRKLPDSGAMFSLAAKYVPEATHYNLMDSRLAFSGIVSELWSLYLQMFKSAVVVLNPPTWARQLYGQTIFWIYAGLNPLTHRGAFQEAARHLRHGLDDPLVRELAGRNLLHGGVDKEFAGYVGDALRTPTNGVAAAIGSSWQRMKKVKRDLGQLYQFLDHVSVMASWIRDVEHLGLPKEVAIANLGFFQNYERLGTAAKFLRKFPLGDPFISFSDQAIKITLKAMREHPGRVLAVYAAPAIINLAARTMWGVTDDEMRILNSHAQRRSLIDRYFQPVMFRDSAGMVHTLDLRWTMPLASDFRVQTGPGGIGVPFMLKQPIFGPAFETMFNRELYSGRDISNEPLTFWQSAAHIVWESLPVPSIGTRAPMRLYRAGTGESGENLIQVVLKEVFGVSIMPRYASKAESYRLVREALGDRAARRAVKLIEAYNRLRRPGTTPMSGQSVGQSYSRSVRNAARRAVATGS